MEENGVDPDQTAPTGAVWSGPTLFVIKLLKHFIRQQKRMTFIVIDALRVNILVTCKRIFWQAVETRTVF